MDNMHIYSEEEYLKKQKVFALENMLKNVSKTFCRQKSGVIKDYIYYAEPIKID